MNYNSNNSDNSDNNSNNDDKSNNIAEQFYIDYNLLNHSPYNNSINYNE